MREPGWLQGKQVLVTRPAAQAAGLVAAIESRGGAAIALPVLAIEPLPECADRTEKIIHLDRYDLVIVTSPNAAQLGLAAIDCYWPQLPAGLCWFTVGKATAAVLKTQGIDPRVPASGFNSEALLTLPELQQLKNRRVLILKGEGGRQLLAETLAARGAQVDSLYLYRRAPIPYSERQLARLLAVPPDVLTATSVDILQALDELLAEHLPVRFELPLVVASERIAAVAEALGYHQVYTASDAADESIVTALNVIG